MKNQRRQLYFLFSGIIFLCFVSFLGWYLLDSFSRSSSKESSLKLEHQPDRVQVVEEHDLAPEEKIPLPDISAAELAFRQKANQVLEDFPRKSILQEPNRELHKPPRELVEASSQLGILEDLLDRNPTLTREGLQFYRRCALKQDILTSLRGLCLHNLKTRAKAAGLDKKIRWEDFPAHLHRIADKL